MAMPTALKIVTAISLLSPLIAVGSILTGNVATLSDQSYRFGAAKNLPELILVVLATIPVFFCALLILNKKNTVRYLYPLPWLLLCISPLLLESVRSQPSSFLVETTFNVLIGVLIGLYLIFSVSSKNYFKGK